MRAAAGKVRVHGWRAAVCVCVRGCAWVRRTVGGGAATHRSSQTQWPRGVAGRGARERVLRRRGEGDARSASGHRVCVCVSVCVYDECEGRRHHAMQPRRKQRAHPAGTHHCGGRVTRACGACCVCDVPRVRPRVCAWRFGWSTASAPPVVPCLAGPAPARRRVRAKMGPTHTVRHVWRAGRYAGARVSIFVAFQVCVCWEVRTRVVGVRTGNVRLNARRPATLVRGRRTGHAPGYGSRGAWRVFAWRVRRLRGCVGVRHRVTRRVTHAAMRGRRRGCRWAATRAEAGAHTNTCPTTVVCVSGPAGRCVSFVSLQVPPGVACQCGRGAASCATLPARPSERNKSGRGNSRHTK